MKVFRYILLGIAFLGFLSCQRDDISTNQKDKYNVTTTEAKNLAGLASQVSFKTSMKASGKMEEPKQRSVKEIIAYPNEESPSFYIINYVDNGGFILLAADKRSVPVIASSAHGNFIFNDKTSPELKTWVDATTDYIQNIEKDKSNRAVTSSTVNPLWDGPCPDAIFRGIDPAFGINTVCEMEPCNYKDIEIAPKINTTWGQGVGYNDQLVNMSCSNYSNGRPPVGCVATAMGQVMKYYSYPTTYNWSAVPLTYPTSETAKLMKNIGQAVSMDWQCNGSGADTQNDVATAFRNNFGYKSAKYMNFDSYKMITELQAGRVLIMRGGQNVNGNYTNGHAWVVEGGRMTWTCDWNWDTGQVIGAYSNTYGYMNWGWSGIDNGYYQTEHLNNSGGSFNYKTGMVYDIRP